MILEFQTKRVKAFKDAFSTEAGKIVLQDLVKECGLFRNSFTGDINSALINEGKRNVLLYILSIINVDLPTLLKMVEDNRKEISNDE